MIAAPLALVTPGAVWTPANIARHEREARNGHRAAVLWFTGSPASGKSTLSRALERHLFARGCQTALLDGDQLRHGLCGDLGFSPAGRAENIRRAGHAAQLFFAQGCLVLCAFVSPYRIGREQVRALFPAGRFFEIAVACGIDERRRRDLKGLYVRGDHYYEPALAPDYCASTEFETTEETVTALHHLLVDRGIIG